MFAYILHAQNNVPSEQTDDFFRRFTQTPGLLHAFELIPANGEGHSAVVAIWESREAAERYLNSALLRKQVDESIPQVKRVMYEVRGHKEP